MIFTQLCQQLKVPVPVKEYKFSDTRKFKMDYAWPDHKICLEVEGGVWTGGRHTSPRGFLKDIEKYNLAASMGWRVLRTTPKNLLTHSTIELIKQSIKIK